MSNKIDSIAFICEGLSYEYGGQAVSIPSLGNALSKKSLQVSYFITENRTSRINKIDSLSKVFFCKPYGKKTKFSIELFFKLRRNRNTFDLVHINNLWNFVPLVTFIFCMLYAKPFVISTRGMAMSAVVQNSFFKNIFFKIIFYPILQKAKFIHTTSLNERNNLKKLGITNNIILSPNGINNIIKKPDFDNLVKIRQKAKTILFVGRICAHKNIDILIRAFAIFSKNNTDWKLSIIGNYDDPKYAKFINNLIMEENIQKQINIPGFKTSHDLVEEYEKASFFISSSKSENFGLSIAEALRAGLPAIVPLDSPWEFISEHNCGYATKPDIFEIANAMTLIITNLTYRKNIFYNAINYTKNFSWEAQAKKLQEEYNKN